MKKRNFFTGLLARTRKEKSAVLWSDETDALCVYTDPVQLVNAISDLISESFDKDNFIEIEDNTWIITEDGVYRWDPGLAHYCFAKGCITKKQLAKILFSPKNRDDEVDVRLFMQDEYGRDLIDIAERRLAV